MRKIGNSFQGIQKNHNRYVKGFLASGEDVLIFTPEGAAWACEQSRIFDLKAGHCINMATFMRNCPMPFDWIKGGQRILGISDQLNEFETS